MLKIYNTLGREKQDFKPLKDGQVLMYHCGPTVYWTQHIGNMRGMLMADLIRRTFEYLDYQVKFVRNYTDVGHLTSDSDTGEDKMAKAAQRDQLNPEQVADKYIKIFENDTNELNIKEPDFKPRATQMIPEIISMVQTLLDKGFAYTTDLAIYFDISKIKNYTQLSGQKMEENIKNAGKGEVLDSDKKNSADFALWFFKAGAHKNALQFWPSPFHSKQIENGEGFPGWHIECSAMTKKFLGETIDIHMGGIEHIPVHHTNEIAQSEAANDVKFVNYWLHNEHLTVDNKKMSKSEGTSYALSEIKDKNFEPLILRYFFLQSHYRSKQNFTWESLKASTTAYNRLVDFMTIKDFDIPTKEGTRINKRNKIIIDNYKKEFLTYISDDFNIPASLSLAWEIIKDEQLDCAQKKELLLGFDKVWGLRLDKVQKIIKEIPAEIKKLATESEQARKNNDYQKADELRALAAEKGFPFVNTSNGIKFL